MRGGSWGLWNDPAGTPQRTEDIEVTYQWTIIPACLMLASQVIAGPSPVLSPAGGDVAQANQVTGTTATKTVTVEVLPGPPVVSCSSSPPGRVHTDMVTFLSYQTMMVDVTKWKNLPGFDVNTGQHHPWPEIIGNRFNIGLRDGEYIALKFTTPPSGYAYNPAAYGPWVGPSTFYNNSTPGVAWSMSVSPCPGDFDNSSSNPSRISASCYQVYGTADSAKLHMAIDAPSSFCSLEPGNTYYLNIRPGSLTGSNGCQGPGECSISIEMDGYLP